jgi:Di-haem oxidoreductase, putative peroxidase
MMLARVLVTVGAAGSVAVALLAAGAQSAPAPATPAQQGRKTLPAVALAEAPAFPLPSHVESADIATGAYTFERMFAAGDALFHTTFNGLDGVGSAVRKDGSKVSRFAPPGPKGPGSQGCGECHAVPFAASAGLAHSSVGRDKKGTTEVNVRSVTSLFGNGILQLLAQEMTEDLLAIRDAAASAAKAAPGTPAIRDLTSKGTRFGRIAATATADGQIGFDTSAVVGIDPDLVVRPMGWKGDAPMVRNVTVGAAAGGMGMIGDELVWKKAGAGKHPDVDGDGVGRELSVGDITAMTVYTAAQETPTELGRLASLGYVAAPSAGDASRIEAGRRAFVTIGCARCHTPEMRLQNTRFEEPTLRGNGHYYDAALAALDKDYDPKRPFAFDLLKDAQPPRVKAAPGGGAVIRLYGDLKRHAMGRLLADPAGPSESSGPDLEDLTYKGSAVMIPADHFLTAELWGVGNTGPWLHDNRAGTLREAILLHGEDVPPAVGAAGRSEAQEARDAFVKGPAADQEAVVTFLLSLRTFSPERR